MDPIPIVDPQCSVKIFVLDSSIQCLLCHCADPKISALYYRADSYHLRPVMVWVHKKKLYTDSDGRTCPIKKFYDARIRECGSGRPSRNQSFDDARIRECGSGRRNR